MALPVTNKKKKTEQTNRETKENVVFFFLTPFSSVLILNREVPTYIVYVGVFEIAPGRPESLIKVTYLPFL